MKKFFAVDSHIWGHGTLREIPVEACAVCGRHVSRLVQSSREFYQLDEQEVRISIVEETNAFGHPREILQAKWAREHSEKVSVGSLVDGYDEQGRRTVLCRSCADVQITAVCTRCGCEFKRSRGLTGGWACEKCFDKHCTAACSIQPSEALMVITDVQVSSTVSVEFAHKLAKASLEAAEYGITVNMGMPAVKRFRSLRIRTGLAKRKLMLQAQKEIATAG